MKKKIVLSIGFIVILFLCWMAYNSITKLNEKDEVELTQQVLGKVLAKLEREDIKIGSSSILIFFNSECEHCQWEMKHLEENLASLKEHQVLLISFEPEHEAIRFLKQHKLSRFYLKTSPENVMSSFIGGVPQTLLYKGGNLIKHFNGSVKIEAIIDEFAPK